MWSSSFTPIISREPPLAVQIIAWYRRRETRNLDEPRRLGADTVVDAGEEAEFVQGSLLVSGWADGARIGAGKGGHRQQQDEVSGALEQAEVADLLIVHVADRAGAGDADAVERFIGSRSGLALGKGSRIEFGRLRGDTCEPSSGIRARLCGVERRVIVFALQGSRGDASSMGAVWGWGTQRSLGPVLVCRDAVACQRLTAQDANFLLLFAVIEERVRDSHAKVQRSRSRVLSQRRTRNFFTCT